MFEYKKITFCLGKNGIYLMDKINNPTKYSLGEEKANAITHGVGIILSMVGLIFLIIKAVNRGDKWHVISFVIFGLALFLLYLSSTLYHLIQKKSVKRIMRKIDHSAIFLLIAGTYTPFLLTNLRGSTGWIMFYTVWGFALGGIIIKISTRIRSKWISAIIYLVMGWMAILIYRPMIERFPCISIVLLVSGGLIYTSGVIFYVRKKLRYHHAIWHLFVLGGSICHFFAVYMSF